MEEHEEEIQEDEVPIRRSSRQTRPSSKLKDLSRIRYNAQFKIIFHIITSLMIIMYS
jgi:hypothetical protein